MQESLLNMSIRLLPLIIASLLSTQVQADDFTIQLGGFYSQSDTNMEVTNPISGNNFTLDYESDLQLAKTNFYPLSS